MDTKSKNINEENVYTDSKVRASKFDEENSYEEMVRDFERMKLTRTIMMIFLAMAIALTFISGNDFNKNRHLFKDASMYNWTFLGDDIDEFTRKVLTFGELYKTEEYVKDVNNITTKELDIAREWANDQIEVEYSQRVEKLYEEDTSDWSEARWQKEQDNIREEIKNEYGYDDETLKKLIIEEKTANFERIKNYLDSQQNLKYIVYDRANNLWMSNYRDGNKDGVAFLKGDSGYFAEHHISGGNKQSFIYIDGEKMTPKDLDKANIHRYDGSYYNDLAIEYTRENPYGGTYSGIIGTQGDLDIYIAVPMYLEIGDTIYNGMEEFEKSQKTTAIQMWGSIGGLLLTSILLIALKKIKYKGSYLDELVNKLKKYPIEFNIIGLIVLLMVRAIMYYYNWDSYYRNTLYFRNVLMWTIVFLGVYVVFKVAISKYKEGKVFQDSYLIKFYEYVQICLEKRSFGRKLFLILAIYVVGLVVGGFLLIVGFDEAGLIIAICGAIAATVIFVFTTTRDLAYLNKITKIAKDISEGRSSEDIPEKRKGALRDLAHSINNMKEGLRTSIANETKSERMKTELITNVSHDLKTPLTSIINYVDLLKRCDVQPEEAKTYVEVLDKKSQRLKILIDDLFEASKAASGAMQLTFTKVEVIALLRQTLGEAEGRIEKANLDFKLSVPKEKVYISADGRKIWRVFENLVSNIIKYSLQGTRVYIDVTEYDGKVYITMKNISAYELNFDSEEITERFKRGEESRHTEGSGLGLAIAKNIVNLHGGELKIDIDGDLFKSTVIFDVDDVEKTN